MTMQSLQRHKRSCNGWIPVIQTANDSVEREEGIPHCTKLWHGNNIVISASEAVPFECRN